MKVYSIFIFLFLYSLNCYAIDELNPIVVKDESGEQAESSLEHWDSSKQSGKIHVEQSQNLPGIDIQRAGGAGQPASLFYRGSRSGDSLIYLNGLLMNDPISTSGAVDFSSFPLVELESIIQINGPRALTLEKSSAGTILELNSQENHALHSSATLGNPLYRSASINYEGFFLSALKAKQLSAADQQEGNSEIDPHKILSIGGNRYFSIAKNCLLRISGTGSYSKTDTDSRGGPGGDSLGTFTRSKFAQGGLSLETNTSFFDELQFGLRSDIRDRFDNTLGNTNFLSKSYGLSTKGKASFHKLQNQSGLYYTYTEGKSTDLPSTFVERILSLYSYFSLDTKNWGPSLSIRGDFTNSNQYLSTIGQLSRFFWKKRFELYYLSKLNQKNPNLYQLYSRYGNRNLRSEKFMSHEIGLQFHTSSAEAKLALFTNRAKNLIDYDFILSKYKNIGESGTNGIELTSKWDITKKLTNDLSVTYMQARDLITKLALLRRPRLYGHGGLSYQFNNQLKSKVQFVYLGERTDYHPTLFTIQKLPSHFTVEQAIDWQISKAWLFTLEGKNLLDKKYQDISGYGTLGRSVLLTIENHFL